MDWLLDIWMRNEGFISHALDTLWMAEVNK